MNTFIETTIEGPKANITNEISKISAFRWHYYIILLLSLSLFSSITTKVCANMDRKQAEIKQASHPAVECVRELNDLVCLLKK